MWMNILGWIVRMTNKFLDDTHPAIRSMQELGFKKMPFWSKRKYRYSRDEDMVLCGLFTGDTKEGDLFVVLALYTDVKALIRQKSHVQARYQLASYFGSVKDRNKFFSNCGLTIVFELNQLDKAVMDSIVAPTLTHIAMQKFMHPKQSKEEPPETVI